MQFSQGGSPLRRERVPRGLVAALPLGGAPSQTSLILFSVCPAVSQVIRTPATPLTSHSQPWLPKSRYSFSKIHPCWGSASAFQLGVCRAPARLLENGREHGLSVSRAETCCPDQGRRETGCAGGSLWAVTWHSGGRRCGWRFISGLFRGVSWAVSLLVWSICGGERGPALDQQHPRLFPREASLWLVTWFVVCD